MSTIYLKVVNSNGVLQQSKTFVPTRSGQPTIKVTAANGAYVPYPVSVPTIQSQTVSSLTQYSNTTQMLANDATTYANAIAFVQNNYINSSSLTLSSLTDVVITEPLANNSTLVYNTANNKYVVKELGVDGGTF